MKKLAVSALFGWLFFSTLSSAEDYTTNIISGVNVVTNNVVVGASGAFNVLEINSGGTLTGTTAIVGAYTSAHHNSVLITNPGSTWDIPSHLFYLGLTGAYNSVVVSDGGCLKAFHSHVGTRPQSSNNTALVSGPGSLWRQFFHLLLGEAGPGNSLTVSNGGLASCVYAYMGSNQSSCCNSLLIDGSNSVFEARTHVAGPTTYRGTVHAGFKGAGNEIVVQNGGWLSNVYSYVGYATNSDGNSVVVSGPGSKWSCDLLRVGMYGCGNSLLVENGACATSRASAGATIGYGPGSSGNVVRVTGPGSAFHHDLMVGLGGANNEFHLENGAYAQSQGPSIGAASRNLAVISGTGTMWRTWDGVTERYTSIGTVGSENEMRIEDGAIVDSGTGFISRGGWSNRVVVTGDGSIWSNRFMLYVGEQGSHNQLVISNGAAVYAMSQCQVGGYGGGACYNAIVVTGTNSLLRAGVDAFQFGTYLGLWGISNSISVLDGGRYETARLEIGTQASTGSLLRIDGGSVTVANSTGTGLLNVGKGVVLLESGALSADILDVTNPLGQFIFNGGTLRCGSLPAGNGEVFVVGDGVRAAGLELGGGTAVFADGLLIQPLASLSGTGTASATSIDCRGLMSPGASAGTLTLRADVDMSDTAEMKFEIGGYAQSSEYDYINIASNVVLDGVLTIRFINGFRNAVTNGSSFTLLTASSISGAFTNVANGSRLSTADGAGDFLVAYAGTSLIVSDYQAAEDSDGDGMPDDWEDAYGLLSNDPSDGELDNDGDGSCNLEEYLADTSPVDGSSRLRFVGVEANAGTEIRWRGGVEAWQLLEATTVPDGEWFPLITNVPPTPLDNSWTDGTDESTKIYRIRTGR